MEYDKGGGSVGSSLLLFLVTKIYKNHLRIKLTGLNVTNINFHEVE